MSPLPRLKQECYSFTGSSQGLSTRSNVVLSALECDEAKSHDPCPHRRSVLWVPGEGPVGFKGCYQGHPLDSLDMVVLFYQQRVWT